MIKRADRNGWIKVAPGIPATETLWECVICGARKRRARVSDKSNCACSHPVVDEATPAAHDLALGVVIRKCGPMSYGEIGALMELTAMQVRNIEAVALAKLRAGLAEFEGHEGSAQLMSTWERLES